MDPTGHSCEEIPEGSYARQQCEKSQQAQPVLQSPQQSTPVIVPPASADSEVRRNAPQPPCTFNDQGGWQCLVTLSVEDYEYWVRYLERARWGVSLILGVVGAVIGGGATQAVSELPPLAISVAIVTALIAALGNPITEEYNDVLGELNTSQREQGLGENGQMVILIMRPTNYSPMYLTGNPRAVPTEVEYPLVMSSIIFLVNHQLGVQIPMPAQPRPNFP